jgi:hypothetical protein
VTAHDWLQATLAALLFWLLFLGVVLGITALPAVVR